MEIECKVHGNTRHRIRPDRQTWQCVKCSTEAVAKHRLKKKQALVDEMGGGCQACGYNTYLGALEFHHVDPANKAFTFGKINMGSSLAKLRAEAEKCVVLCSNCHREVEAGIREL